MRIVYLTNIVIPIVAEELHMSKSNSGGWITGLINELINVKNVELTICFPILNEKKLIYRNIKTLDYYGFPQKKDDVNHYNKYLEKYFKDIINNSNPDLVHILGTEFPHTLAMVNICNELNIKTVISIQGLTSVIANHYMNGVPCNIQNKFTLRDFIRQDNLKLQQEKFKNRGKFEIEAIKKTNNIIGRTAWDKACSKLINQNIIYYSCNETLRESFYKNMWSLDHCEKFSIFASQGTYPIKGLHILIEAFSIIKKQFPKAHLYVAGNDIFNICKLTDKLKQTTYAKYIKKLITNLRLNDSVSFTGSLNEVAMCERYLKSHVFVSSSLLENESNSLSEAKILGLPSVASFVGGVTDRINHGIDGFHYQHDAPYMLAYYVNEIFSNDEIAYRFSKNARENALKIHDREDNLRKILQIYTEITSS